MREDQEHARDERQPSARAGQRSRAMAAASPSVFAMR